ncbi:MAG: class I SAM-dependent methyltransferase [Cyanobacteria bacterium P01_D01_bin.56]
MFSDAAAYLENSRRSISNDLSQVIAKALQGCVVSNFIDVGCGIGFLAEVLHELYPESNGLGIDASKELIAAAKRRTIKGIEFQHGNVYEIAAADNTYDLTACQTLLIHLKDPKAAILEMLRVTKGRLLIIEPVIHSTGAVGFVPGDAGEKKQLRDRLLRFDIDQKYLAGIDMQVATKIPHLLLDVGASDVCVDSFNVLTFSDTDKFENEDAPQYNSYDCLMLDLGYDKGELDQLKRIESKYQQVKGEVSIVTLLVISAHA